MNSEAPERSTRLLLMAIRREQDVVLCRNLGDGSLRNKKRLSRMFFGSRDLVTAITGRAGTGKTTMAKEAVKAVQTLSGRSVIVLAPSSVSQTLKGSGANLLSVCFGLASGFFPALCSQDRGPKLGSGGCFSG